MIPDVTPVTHVCNDFRSTYNLCGDGVHPDGDVKDPLDHPLELVASIRVGPCGTRLIVFQVVGLTRII